jgi:hypothetical protein
LRVYEISYDSPVEKLGVFGVYKVDVRCGADFKLSSISKSKEIELNSYGKARM